MESFGVHFRIDRPDLLPALERVFDALRQAKRNEDFGSVEAWRQLLAVETRSRFDWPDAHEGRNAIVDRAPVIITEPHDAIGQTWEFDSLLDAIENGEYDLLEIARTTEGVAELRIDPHAYPYGGIGAFMALVEAHGMYILGVNEYGKYLSRSELT